MQYLHSFPALERVVFTPPQGITTAAMHNRIVIVLSYDPTSQSIDKEWCSHPCEGSDKVVSAFDALLAQYRILGNLLGQTSLSNANKTTQTATVNTVTPKSLLPVHP